MRSKHHMGQYCTSENVLYPVEFAKPNSKDADNQKAKTSHGS